MNVAAQIRSIEAAAQRLKADEMRIDELKRRRQTTAGEIADATRELVVMLAAGKGLLTLTPPEIVAAFEQLSLPKTVDPEEKGRGACDSSLPPEHLGMDQVANVTVEYTVYKGGPRVALLEELGLKRGGHKGFWSGLVDRDGLDRLSQEFPKKVKINAVHSQSTLPAAGAQQEIGVASERSGEKFERTADEPVLPVQEKQGPEKAVWDIPEAREVGDVATQTATPAEGGRPITAAIAWPRPFPALPRRVVPNAIPTDGNEGI